MAARDTETAQKQVILPPEYPTSAPPIYQLNAPWLRRQDYMELGNSLEEIYVQNLGESILYLWVEKIREVLVEKSQSSDPGPVIKKITEEIEEDYDDDFSVDYQLIQDDTVKTLNFIIPEGQEGEELPQIHHGNPITDRRSTFQAHLAPVVSPKQVKTVLDKLYENKKIENATHNIYAYRIYCEDKQTYLQDCEDDGETAAGGRLLHLMQILHVRNVLVVVSRWYGGILLGPDRFKHINSCARNILVEYNYTNSAEESSKQLGAFCIPLYIPYILTGKWPFGRGLCKLWLVVDYLMCTASVFNIVLISYDRFLSVTKAVSYRINPGITSKAIAMMVAIWVFAFLLYGPAIIIWEYVVGCSIVPDKKCYAEFIYNWHLLLGASIFEFFTPLILVAYFNIQIFRSIQNRLTTIPQELSESPKSKSQVRRLWCLLKEDASFSDSETEKSCSTSGSQRHLSTSDRPRPSHLHSHTCETDPIGSFKVKTSHKLQRDKKIAKSLAIIVCIFVICWAPYSLLIIIFAACDGNCIKPYLYEISFWLLWLNSSVNPFLYPLCHVKFRNAFRKILCPYKRAESSPRPSVSF